MARASRQQSVVTRMQGERRVIGGPPLLPDYGREDGGSSPSDEARAPGRMAPTPPVRRASRLARSMSETPNLAKLLRSLARFSG